jgi:hypothetical protein
MSLNPQHIIFDGRTGCCDIDYDYTLENTLKLNTLPLTHEQTMLNMTPSGNIDFFEVLYELMADFYPR